ncbi:MAG TPA: hypothetical protein VFI84_01565 [Candidatus Saccharimonadales bacterium]|nr:hypothetical protein [Candidatus Saccharimonadales bacterium]
MFNPDIENWQHAMVQQNAKEQKEQKADKTTVPAQSSTDAIMTPEFVDKVIEGKLERLGEAAARKEAAHAADKAEAAEMMAEIAVRDALEGIQPDQPQQ